jgi:signal transduction histidine kinase
MAENAESNGGAQVPDFSSGGGSGLGLSIVQAIATAHGGQATLESWTGHGTRVRIWLPSRANTVSAQ